MTFPNLPADAREESSVGFHAHGVESPPLFSHVAALETWLSAVAKTHNARISSLDYVLCDDDFLHAMNVERLAHDTLTDIITFDLSDDPTAGIQGECYISLPRVHENAVSYAEVVAGTAPETTELLRVIAHGLLHLCGLGDKSEAEAEKMRAAEDEALYIWRSRFDPRG